MRACRELGVGAVAVYSEADATAPHVARRRRRGVHRPGAEPRELPQHRRHHRRGARARAPRRSIPATASSPRTPRSRAPCGDAGLTFIGPSPDGDRGDGRQDAARARIVAAAGVPVVPAVEDPPRRRGEPRSRGATRLGYPLLIKAAAGGGGKGMRIVRDQRRVRWRPSTPPRARRGGVRRRAAVPRALRRAAAPRRGAGARRPARRHRAPRRARVLDPAPPSEDHRGDAVAGGRRRRCASA